MTDSQRLLAEYVKHGSEGAFQELVACYLDLVYSTAVRLVGNDTHLAEDVAQIVFTDLARTAKTLPNEVRLGGWLHRHTCFVAAKTMRGERRRQARERQAVEMNALQDHTEGNLSQVAPMLDEAINQLGAEDRAAILLRFFERLDFRSVGAALGSNEAAAQKRVARALEKLHLLLKHRGVTLSAATLGTALAGEAVTAAPARLAVRISTSALANVAAGGGALTILKIMSMTKLQLGICAILITGATITLVNQKRTQIELGKENQALQQQIEQLQSEHEKHTPRLAAPRRQITARPGVAVAEDLQATNLVEHFAKDGKPIKLTRDQVDAYLKTNGRNAATLLAAFRASDDPTLLQEAMEKFPNDPRVDFAAIFRAGASPQEQRQWLNAFQQSAPNNSLANYLSALNHFQSGQTGQAVQELSAAAGKAQFEDYARDGIQGDVEAFLASGYSEADAKVFGGEQLQMAPMNSGLRELGQDMVGVANTYQQAGDEASAQTALQMAVNLGQRLDGTDGPFVISQMIGMIIEGNAFNAMDPASPFGDAGQTVQDQINQLAQQRASLKELGDQFNSVTPMMSNQDWINYRDRELSSGQVAAARWAVGKYGRQ
jgi:RNA polymerase sigma factor (sigma-70 family)